MKAYNNNSKKIIAFALAFIATTIMAAFLISFIWNKDAVPVSQVAYMQSTGDFKNNAVIAGLDALTETMTGLNELDKQYSLLSSAGNTTQLDAIEKKIADKEKTFQSSVNTISENISSLQEKEAAFATNTIAGFRLILEDRNYISSLRNTLKLKNNNFQPNDELRKAQNTIVENGQQIALLEGQLKNAGSNNNIIIKNVPEMNTEKLKILNENISKQNNDISNLTMSNSRLKQDNDRLLQQKNETAKNAAVSETRLKERIAALEQNMEEASADLRLAQVDCNLTRVDAGKIIYTSKQRKELLSEASGILNNLARSGDESIRKKIASRVARLNKVAANSKD
ncbi:MAG: hypothetical protein ABI402_07685 [Ferruginibacter sp.]